MYLDFLKSIAHMLETLNRYEREHTNLFGDTPSIAGYIASPIPVHFDGVHVGELRHEIDDEWCYVASDLEAGAD